MVQTIKGVLNLYQDVVTDSQSFLLTGRLNQDPLENLFGVLRRRSGYNNNLSAKEFRRNLQHSLSIRLMNPPESANCEPDGDDNLRIDESLQGEYTSDSSPNLPVLMANSATHVGQQINISTWKSSYQPQKATLNCSL